MLAVTRVKVFFMDRLGLVVAQSRFLDRCGSGRNDPLPLRRFPYFSYWANGPFPAPQLFVTMFGTSDALSSV